MKKKVKIQFFDVNNVVFVEHLKFRSTLDNGFV